LVGDFALPLPASVIAEPLGAPAKDQGKFHRRSSRLVSVSSSRDTARALPAALSFVRYLRGLVGRRADPEEDLITELIRAGEECDYLSKGEILAVAFLLVAGHETTVNPISGGTLALLRHPEQPEVLRRDPSRSRRSRSSCATPLPGRS
jgi:cytochrome P450